LIKVLRVVGAFGIGGSLRAQLFSENLPDHRIVYSQDGRKFQFRILRFLEKSRAIIAIDGVADRTAAESLKNECFYLKRDDLPATAPGEFYLCDLVGREVAVMDSDLRCKILGVQNYGAGDLLEISYGEEAFFVPFTRENFPNAEGEILMTRAAFEGFRK
jgi:16S rRNA processing protein RimM